ncbi:hypothetical protein GLOIN_2v1482460 [Rhizophagus clarus]|uniref:Uncharacterized protein n=1 Tax=Rhizophagus clarus TaxID=94130 RepID=A0A8H3KZ29_9GLOM|nr:hypothetical protein GLOIN_2v1482460 [Rhizophagus clarus]
MPSTLYGLLDSIIQILCEKRREHANKQKNISVNAAGITRKHEKLLEIKRMEAADPKLRIWKNPNIWNICVIDNIDFKEKTFTYRNIYDTTRSSSHATLRLLFQYQLLVELNSIPDEEIQLNENTKLFGENLITNEVSLIFNTIFIQLLNCQTISNLPDQFSFEYDAKIINEKIINYFNHGPFCPPVHIIILEAGDNPNKDVNIKTACNQYFDDLQIDNDLGIEVVCDEAILEGVLLTIFLGYGIYNMAAILGETFLDKLEKVINYCSTCRVLDLIWVAIGSAIHIYILKNNLKLEAIMDSENNLLKIWFWFYHWAGFWKEHRVGIRTGNAELQTQCLSAFAPLFPIAVNLTRDEHYFAFDEALKTFGVKFIKQNVTRNVINEESLKRQIKAAQQKKERMNLLFDEFLGDIVLSAGTRAVNRRQEKLWELTKQLIDAFEMADGTQHLLFQNCDQLTSEGFEAIDTKGRRAKGVITTKVTDLKSKTQKTKKKNIHPPDESYSESSMQVRTIEAIVSPPVSSELKSKRHYPSKEEREVLETLSTYDVMPPDAAIDSVLTSLLTYWDGWTKKKIKSVWKYGKRKEKQNQENIKT